MFADVATVIGAIAAGTEATLTTATVLSAVAEVGVALSVGGAVTGNKDMSEVGGVMSLVGGVGSIASDAFSSGSLAANSDVGTLQGGDSTMANMGTDGTTTMPDGSTIDANGNYTAPSNSPIVNNAAGQPLSGPSVDPTTGQPYTLANQQIGAGGGSDSALPIGSSSSNVGSDAPLQGNTSTGGVNSGKTDSGSWLQNTLKGYSPQAQSALIMGGMGALGGLSKMYTSQKELELQNQQLALQQQQLSNLSAQPTFTPTPSQMVAAPAPLVPAAAPQAPQQVIGTGLLQQPNKSNT